VVGLAWSKDLESYAGGSVASSKASHVGLVKGEMGYPGNPGWGLRMKLTSPHTKLMLRKSQRLPQAGLINRRQSGYKEKDLTFDTWKIQTLFKTGGLISLLSQVKPRTTGIHHLENTSQIRGTQGWRRRVEDTEEWRHLLREAGAQMGL